MSDAAALVSGLTSQHLGEWMLHLPQSDPWTLLHGRDCLTILHIGLRSRLAEKAPKPKDLESDFRLAVSTAMFQSTQLYTAIRDWEQVNHPYRLLKSP